MLSLRVKWSRLQFRNLEVVCSSEKWIFAVLPTVKVEGTQARFSDFAS